MYESMASLLNLPCFLIVISFAKGPSAAQGRDPLLLKWPHLPETLVEGDYDTVSYPKGSGSILQWSLKRTVPSTGRNYTIHIGSLNSGLPDTFSFQLPDGGKKLRPGYVEDM